MIFKLEAAGVLVAVEFGVLALSAAWEVVQSSRSPGCVQSFRREAGDGNLPAEMPNPLSRGVPGHPACPWGDVAVHTFLEKSGFPHSQAGCLSDVLCQHLLLWATYARSALKPSLHWSHRCEGLTSWLGRARCGLCTPIVAVTQPAARHRYPSGAVVSWNLCEGCLWGPWAHLAHAGCWWAKWLQNGARTLILRADIYRRKPEADILSSESKWYCSISTIWTEVKKYFQYELRLLRSPCRMWTLLKTLLQKLCVGFSLFFWDTSCILMMHSFQSPRPREVGPLWRSQEKQALRGGGGSTARLMSDSWKMRQVLLACVRR